MDTKPFFGINSQYDFTKENKLRTILPLSSIKYYISKGNYIPYITYDQETENYNIEKINENIFEGELLTEYKIEDDRFINFPPHDIKIRGKSDYESKICVFPCQNVKKIKD